MLPLATGVEIIEGILHLILKKDIDPHWHGLIPCYILFLAIECFAGTILLTRKLRSTGVRQALKGISYIVISILPPLFIGFLIWPFRDKFYEVWLGYEHIVTRIAGEPDFTDTFDQPGYISSTGAGFGLFHGLAQMMVGFCGLVIPLIIAGWIVLAYYYSVVPRLIKIIGLKRILANEKPSA